MTIYQKKNRSKFIPWTLKKVLTKCLQTKGKTKIFFSNKFSGLDKNMHTNFKKIFQKQNISNNVFWQMQPFAQHAWGAWDVHSAQGYTCFISGFFNLSLSKCFLIRLKSFSKVWYIVIVNPHMCGNPCSESIIVIITP